MEIKHSEIVNCSACGSSKMEKILEMPKLSHVGVFCENKEDEKNFPPVDNELHICNECGHGQLLKALDPNFLYNTGFQHCTSCSMSAKQANDWLYEFITEDKNLKFDVIAEIGINDSYFLKKFAEKSKKVIGVDPILRGREETLLKDVPDNLKDKFIVIGDFIENVNFLDHLDQKPDLYMSNFVFEHIKEPVNVVRGILDDAKDDALIVIGVPGSEFLYNNSRFDQLSHQHYQQFTKHSLRIMVERAGGEVVRMGTNFPNWGQLAIAFKKKKKGLSFDTKMIFSKNEIQHSFVMFENHMDALKKRLNYIKEKNIFGMGAAQNFPTFCSFYKEDLPFSIVLDDNPKRQNTFFPNLKYKIEKPNEDGSYKNCIGILVGPDYARVLVPRMSQLGFDHIITPYNSH